MQDHTQTQKGMYSEGRTFVRIMLLGICMRTYLSDHQSVRCWRWKGRVASVEGRRKDRQGMAVADPTLRMETATLKSLPVRERSSSKELRRAWLFRECR